MNAQPLKAPDCLTVRSIGPFADELRIRLSTDEAVQLDLTSCVDLDLSALQLIVSARSFASSAGKTLTLTEPARGPLLALLDRAGFLTDMAPAAIDLWFHGEQPQ